MAAPASSSRSVDARSAQDVVQKLGLAPHAEKGYFIETYRDPATDSSQRSVSTAIYYLLEGSTGPSLWHRVDAKILGADVFDNQHPHVVIEKKVWQRATSLGNWTLIGCTVAPAFVEGGFEMAPEDWSPGAQS